MGTQKQSKVDTSMTIIDSITAVLLTHWGRDKMAAISQTTFSSAFSWMKIYEFHLRFHWMLFLTFYSSIDSDNGLAPFRRQAIIWNNDV